MRKKPFVYVAHPIGKDPLGNATLDEIAAHLDTSRGGAVVQLVGLGVEHGYAPRTSHRK